MESKLQSGQEFLTPWRPRSDIPERLCLETIVDTKEGLLISLRENLVSPWRLTLTFSLKDLVCYSVINDSYNLKSSHERKRDELLSLYIVQNSGSLKNLREETYDTIDFNDAVHYCFLLSEEEINIVYFGSPEIKVSDK